MSLANRAWNRVSVHEVVAEFLRGERFKFGQSLPWAEMALIDAPNISDPRENHARLRYLYCFRGHLIGEIPPDTRWYEVRNLTGEELSKHSAVAMRLGGAHSYPLSVSQPTSWARPILWGHEKDGPFTILEGNNRLVAYASQGQQSALMIPALVGLSPTPCCFHIFNPPDVIANDLWKAA